MITLTEEQFKEMIEAAHRAGQHNQGHCDPSVYEAMVYYEREVKKLIIPDVSKSVYIVCENDDYGRDLYLCTKNTVEEAKEVKGRDTTRNIYEHWIL